MSLPAFKNQHLSVSRLRRFERCPLSYRLHYIDRHEPEPTLPLRFGVLLHAVLERLYQWVIEEEHIGPLPKDLVLELYRDEWIQSALWGFATYDEGLAILRAYLRDNPTVDHRSVLAVEQAFRLTVGPFEVVGKIDRVDRAGDDIVEVIDYKSNRVLFTRDEVDADLQLSIYALAARELWPWAKQVRLGFYMLRHGARMWTARTEEQLEAVREYIIALGQQTESATEYPARLNTSCPYCEHRQHCPAYAEAVAGGVEVVRSSPADLEAVSRERAQVASLAKILYARKGELDDVLKAHLAGTDALELGGVRYWMHRITHVDYPLDATLRVFQEVAGLEEAETRKQLLVISKGRVDALVKELGKRMPRARVRLLKTQLDAVAEKTFSPRLYAKEVR
jgi:putative RecB family exonuclease